VGGLPLGRERNAWWGEGYFVIETDESDASFLYYNPWVSIITNIDYEHLDHYKDIENLKKGFLQFAYQTKDLVIGCGDDPFVKEVLHKTGGLSYGFGVDNKIKGANFFFDGESTCFDLIIDNKIIKQVKILLLGQHNILNTLAVLSFLFYLGQDLEKATPLLRDFKGTKRRFQIKKKVGGITFVDDYAHHPTEIAAVLGAAHTLNYKRVFVIVQPHRFSRVQALHKEFSQCFSFADELVVTDIYSASEREINGISGKFLFEEIKKNFSGNIRYIPKDKLIQEIPYSLKEGDLVLGLGAGDINTLMERIANEFEKNRVEA
jgi:UDP-N-acetylmuramate--alanine ligase